jgi:hypothetical protein
MQINPGSFEVPVGDQWFIWNMSARARKDCPFTPGSAQGVHRECTGSTQGVHREYTGSAQGVHREYTRSTQGVHRERTGSTQGVHRERTGSTQGVHREYTESTQGVHREYTGSAQGAHREYTGSTQGVHREYTAVLFTDRRSPNTWQKQMNTKKGRLLLLSYAVSLFPNCQSVNSNQMLFVSCFVNNSEMLTYGPFPTIQREKKWRNYRKVKHVTMIIIVILDTHITLLTNLSFCGGMFALYITNHCWPTEKS